MICSCCKEPAKWGPNGYVICPNDCEGEEE